jgi:ankyrin repeat protein
MHSRTEKNEGFISTLLEHGSDVNVRGSFNRTPLHYALLVAYGKVLTPEKISQLISTENLNMLDAWDETALYIACRFYFHHSIPTDLFTQLISPHNINLTNKYVICHCTLPRFTPAARLFPLYSNTERILTYEDHATELHCTSLSALTTL